MYNLHRLFAKANVFGSWYLAVISEEITGLMARNVPYNEACAILNKKFN